eukprot:5001070-Pleurochrysis_carterae.AAC.1
MREKAVTDARAQSDKADDLQKKLADTTGELAKEKARADLLEVSLAKLRRENENEVAAYRL